MKQYIPPEIKKSKQHQINRSKQKNNNNNKLCLRRLEGSQELCGNARLGWVVLTVTDSHSLSEAR